MDWPNKRILYDGRFAGLSEDIRFAGVLHELGHTVACRDNPNRSDDADSLAWEYLVAKKYRKTKLWYKGFTHYVIDTVIDGEYYNEMCDLPFKLLPKVMTTVACHERLSPVMQGIEKKNLTENLKPVSMR